MTGENDGEEPQPTPSDAVNWSDFEDWDEFDRPRGMLTNTDRKYLWGGKEYKHEQTAINRRKDIRERFENGIFDLSNLKKLSERDRAKLFQAIEEQNSDPGGLRDAVTSLIQFLYLGLDLEPEWFEQTVSRGIDAAVSELDDADRYGGQQVSVDIEISRGHNLDRLEKQVKNGQGHTLTTTEMGVLVREGRLSPEDLEELHETGLGIPNSED